MRDSLGRTMNDGSGPISKPVRVLAAVLGVYMGAGGILLAFGGLASHIWLAVLSSVVGLGLAALLVRAAITGWSPAWPDD